MSDTTDKALDALQERLKAHDSHPESASAQADAAIAALRAELADVERERDEALADVVDFSETAAALVEDMSKRPTTTWGQIKAAVRALGDIGNREAYRRQSEKLKTAEAQLAKARPDALREAAKLVRTKPMRFAGCREDDVRDALSCAILDLIDTPTPSAPSPEAVARAALEWAAEIAWPIEWGSVQLEAGFRAAKDIRTAASDPATLAAIVAKAGGGE